MKAYTYSIEEMGLGSMPEGTLRLEGVDHVSHPDQADVFIVPASLNSLGPEKFGNLPYLAGRERQHVAFNVADDYEVHYPSGPLYLRCEATRAIVDRCPTVRPWAWPVEDYYAPGAPFEYDVTFVGWVSTPLTQTVLDSFKGSSLTTYIRGHNFFFGYKYHDPAYGHWRVMFQETLVRSRLSLVPRSIPQGVIRYRFYEAMSAGRIPVHFNDGRALPWKHKINYDQCSIHIPEASAAQAGPVLADWLGKHNDDQIRGMGAYGRAMWLRYLDARKWPQLMREAVEEHIA